MAGKNPKIKIEPTVFDRFVELVVLFFSIAVFIAVIIVWRELPDTVPTQFGVNGQIRGYGNKLSMLFMLPVAIVMYVSLSLLQRVPHVYNYMVRITEENAERQYRIAIGMMRMIKLEILALFAGLSLITVLSAREGRMVIGIWIVLAFVAGMFLSLGRYFIKSYKAK